MRKYRRFEHTADIGIEAFGATLNELFENAAFGMFDQAVELSKVRELCTERLEVHAEALDLLLRQWLAELLYRFTAKGQVFSRFLVEEVSSDCVQGAAFGEAFDAERHALKTDLKAVTYHQLTVKKTRFGWKCRVIIDV